MNIKARIEEKLTKYFNPTFLDIIDESAAHASHGDFNETSHVLIKMDSELFKDKNPLQKQRMVLEQIKDEVIKIHSVSMLLKYDNIKKK